MENKENVDDDNTPDTPPKKLRKKLTHRMQKFRNAWLLQEDFKLWLTKVSDDPYKAKCKLCDLTFTAEITVIKNHFKTQSHQRRSIHTSQKKIKNFLSDSSNNDLYVKTKEATARFEIKLCAFIAEHNISLRILDHLTPLIKNSVTDSDIVKNMQLKSTKGLAVIKNVLGSTEKRRLQTKLKSNLFSILIDECTDIAAVKSMCIVVRFFDDEEGRIVSRFWDLCQIFNADINISEASAEHVFNFVITSFTKYQISLNNVIGFASDGCNTMMGNYNSVASRFHTECPGIYVFKCICHSLHLCASEACKVLPRSCEDLARNVYNEFKNSAKRIHQFREFQAFLDIKAHKILRPSQTRWLSLNAIVERMIEQWEALHLYFFNQRSTVRLLAVDQIIHALENPLIKLFYLFLEWILPKFNHLNLLFQSEKVVLTTLYDKMSVAYQELLEIYINKCYVSKTKLNDIDPCNKEHYLPLEQVYLGVKVMEYLNKPEISKNDKLKYDFRISCIEFVMVACSQIKKRFDFNNQTLKYLSYLNPPKAVLRHSRDKMPSLLPLMKTLPRIVNNQQYQVIDDEWRQLPHYELPDHIDIKDQVDIFWSKLLGCDEGDQGLTFKNLSKFVLNVISLPHSNADCERIFSKVNLIKTKTRNKIITPTMNGLLLAKQRVQGDCVNFEPLRDEYNCMTSNILYESTESNDIDDVIIPNN